MTTLAELADLVKGKIVGDPTLVITGVSEIQNGRESTITFLGNLKYKKYLLTTGASAVVGNDGYFMERCTIAADTRKCYAAGADWSDATAIASNKVSIIGGNTGGGALYVQQVQITGEA